MKPSMNRQCNDGYLEMGKGNTEKISELITREINAYKINNSSTTTDKHKSQVTRTHKRNKKRKQQNLRLVEFRVIRFN